MVQDNDKLLSDLIKGKLQPANRKEYRSVMKQLTNFVDGVYYKDDNKVVYKDIQDLTSLCVESYDDIEQAQAISFALGVDNSVILVQQNEVIAGSISLDELEASFSDSNKLNTIYGYLVVSYDFPEYKIDEIKEMFFTADTYDIQEVINKQNERCSHLMNCLNDDDMDELMSINMAVSAISGDYTTKDDWNIYNQLKPDCDFRVDVVWHETKKL